ncbi:MAG: SRPBCC domain-containing protein [Planctomycetota bacterium]
MTTEVNFKDGILTATRVYDAPREAVFDAWVNTSKVQLWWGCAQTTSTESCIEQRIGGKYEHTMQIEGAGEFKVCGLITEYSPPARLVYEAADMMGQGPTSEVAIDFTEHPNGGTQVSLRQTGLPEEYIKHVKVGLAASWDKLARFLMSEAA